MPVCFMPHKLKATITKKARETEPEAKCWNKQQSRRRMQSVAFPPSDCHKCQGSHKIHIILKLLHIIIYLSVEKEQQIIGGKN